MKYPCIISYLLLLFICGCRQESAPDRTVLWYDKPAEAWTEALPVGNGRLGAMIYGGVPQEHIQFNEETLWTGQPNDYSHKGASDYLAEIRTLLFDGRQREAEELAMEQFMSVPLRQTAYQPFGDLYIDFPGQEKFSDYRRELDLSDAVCRTSYQVGNTRFAREVFVSEPDGLIVVRLTADKEKALNFEFYLDAAHENKTVETEESVVVLNVSVREGVMKGTAKVLLDTDGDVTVKNNRLEVDNAREAVLYLSASTNFISYKEVSEQPSGLVDTLLANIRGRTYEEIRRRHIGDYKRLFDRFDIDLGTTAKDTLTTDERIIQFRQSPDPQFIALYVQYARYLLISSSRPGTFPANLQGIWNAELAPPWDSKYTVNINTEMNYWPAEAANLSECHEPLFRLIEECSETGRMTAQNHYNAGGWVLHHNTDQWRGTAPINHSNHGIWVSGSGWLSMHLWEHYLFTGDKEFLRDRAYPVMKGAAEFYLDFLIEDPETGFLISVPSNSPENGGLAVGPTMDHQIIRSLFDACVQADAILENDQAFADRLRVAIPQIFPNKIGQYGQLQEWMADADDPENKHRHVSHLWGMHPGKDINWEDSPALMEAARQSLIFRGDDGTGWSLAWKINFWARLYDGNHAFDLIKMLFRPVESGDVSMQGGGSYPNLFDAHPPFQIDGNFGAAAGIIELFIQSHLSSIELLPALPDALPNGSLKGVRARGGFEFDFSWENSRLKKVKVRSDNGGICRLSYGENSIDFETVPDTEYSLSGELILE